MSQLGTDGDDLITANETTVYALDGKDIIFTSLEFTNIYGGEGADFIQNEGEGISYLYGGGSGDTLAGGTVSDYLFGNDGDDLIVGGEFDYLTFLNTGNLVPYNNEVSGSDTLYGDTGNDALYGFDGDDFLYGGDGDDSETISVIDFTGSYVQVAAGLYGGDGADYLDGGRGDDYLDGGADSDILISGEGSDTLLGGAGSDRMEGGGGNDLYYVDNAGDSAREVQGAGNDKVFASVTYSAATTDIEEIELTGSAAINASGNSESNTITGNSGANRLLGEDGADTLTGASGNDKVYGGAGNDLIYGNDGNDYLVGGAGNDRLRGGGQNDTFLFDTTLNSSGNSDTIVDMTNNSAQNDVIWLENDIFTGLALGDLSAGAFKDRSDGKTDSSDRILYYRDSGELYFDRDGSGTTYGAIKFATVENYASLTYSDFFVV